MEGYVYHLLRIGSGGRVLLCSVKKNNSDNVDKKFYLAETLHDNSGSNSIGRSVARIKGIVLYLLGGAYLLGGFSNIHF